MDILRVLKGQKPSWLNLRMLTINPTTHLGDVISLEVNFSGRGMGDMRNNIGKPLDLMYHSHGIWHGFPVFKGWRTP